MYAKEFLWGFRPCWAFQLSASHIDFSPYSDRIKSICRLVALSLEVEGKEKNPSPREGGWR